MHVSLVDRIAARRAARSAWALLHLSVAFLRLRLRILDACCDPAHAEADAGGGFGFRRHSRNLARISRRSDSVRSDLLQTEHGTAVSRRSHRSGSLDTSLSRLLRRKPMCRRRGSQRTPAARNVLAGAVVRPSRGIAALLPAFSPPALGTMFIGQFGSPPSAACRDSRICSASTSIHRSRGCFRALLLLWRYCSPGLGKTAGRKLRPLLCWPHHFFSLSRR